MSKSGFILLLLTIFTAVKSQDNLWFTRTGHIYFISHTDIIDIDANHYQTGSFLNIASGEIALTLLMKSFQFTLPLAEEHFNENYVESEKFPKATFKGKILDFDPSKLLNDIDYKVVIQGDLAIHGVTSSVREQGILRRSGNEIRAVSRFTIQLDTFNIKVPNIVEDRVAKEIPIDVNLKYEPYKKPAGK
ncbi:MAG: YceI family protein [Porphyromonadaceae bacterium]|nr:MAG: YceI family protein [Porphyromonadaceae bacterium]